MKNENKVIGSMEVLSSAIAEYRYYERFSMGALSAKTNMSKEKVTSLIHTLLISGKVHKSMKLNGKQYYRNTPIPNWIS